MIPNGAACCQETYLQECVKPPGYAFSVKLPYPGECPHTRLSSSCVLPDPPSALPPSSGLCSFGVSSPMLHFTLGSTGISVLAGEFEVFSARVALQRRLSLLIRLLASLHALLVSFSLLLFPYFLNVDTKPGFLHSAVSLLRPSRPTLYPSSFHRSVYIWLVLAHVLFHLKFDCDFDYRWCFRGFLSRR